eukprot:TRINITY_DN5649_c0_g1_i1.p1 TRINITY_DN5649_c0_g1~~TRINITY_DN5649_c0_g1_i1.p1  ORF type:complete len:352 (+),score=53.31 TRINITY_DN5649_c0_g1_i1:1-1056(+)
MTDPLEELSSNKTKERKKKAQKKLVEEKEKIEPLAKLSHFRQLETLGTGTFGRVFLVHNKFNGEYYALKILKKEHIVRHKQIQHIKDEKNVLSDLDHPMIVKLYHTYSDSRNLYMLMEYIAGGELFSFLRKYRRFEEPVAKFYAAQLVLVLEYIHGMGVVYRDLKPENILLDSNGFIKLTDFGFAKFVVDRTWTLCGTPEYVAPEIIQSKGHGKAVDWWALGIFIFEMLAGYPPFYDATAFGIYSKILSGKIEFPSNFSPEVKDLISNLLEYDKTKRLGNRSGGATEVKDHPWFKSVNWSKLQNREIPAPIVPKISHSGDTRNFANYPEDSEFSIYVIDSFDPYQDIFKDF